MKTQQIIAILFAFALGLNGANAQTSDSRLEGCLNPTVIAAALEKLRDSRWEDMNVDRVQAIWPTKLFRVDCGSSLCTLTLTDKERIDESDECIDILHYRGKPGSVPEELGNVGIHYAMSRRKDVIAAARVMAKAFGVPERDLAIQGKLLKQDYFWDSSNDVKSDVGVEIRHEGRIWTAYLMFVHYHRAASDQVAPSGPGPCVQ